MVILFIMHDISYKYIINILSYNNFDFNGMIACPAKAGEPPCSGLLY
jgi:hypothetical protein